MATITQTPKRSMANFLNTPSVDESLNKMLGERKAEFVSNLISLCDADKNLAECDPAALMRCAMNATSLNLPLNKNLGFAYVIPYNQSVEDGVNEKGIKLYKKISVPQFQIGYKGFIQLGIRTGYYKYLNATEIREGEIERNKITGEIKLIKEYPDAKIVGYIAYLELQSGFTASYYMSNEQIEAHAFRFSKSYQYDKKNKTMSSKWSDPDARPAMCKKTVLKALIGTYGLMTTEFAKAFDNDSDEVEFHPTNTRFDDAEIIQQDDPDEVPSTEEKPAATNGNGNGNGQPKTIKI